MTHKKVNNADAGTTTKFGGNDLDKWSDFASGVDTDDYTIGSDVTFTKEPIVQVRGLPDYYIYIDAADANKIKSRIVTTGAIAYVHATDAGTVITSTVAALSTAGGGTIAFGRGTFNMATTVSIGTQSNIIFQGAGRDITRFLAVTVGMNMFHKNNLTVVHDITFRDLTVDGADITARLLNTNGNLTRLTIERCHWTRGNAPAPQILVSANNDVTVRDSAFTMGNTNGDLLAIGNTERVIVDGCYFTRTVAGAALTTGGWRDCSITNNMFDNMIGYGCISMENQSSESERCFIAGNHMKGSSPDGSSIKIIYTSGMSETVRYHKNIVIVGNTMTDSGLVRIENFTDQCIIANNVFDGTTNGGLTITANGADYVITGNIFKDSLRGIILTESDGGVTFVDTKRIMISNNQFYNILNDGIEIRGIIFSKIANNMLYNIGIATNATYRGIWVRTSASRVNNQCVVENNHISADAANKVFNAIEASSTTTNSFIERNKIDPACFTNLAIQTSSAAGVRIRNNTGYVTENEGATSIADGGTISHGLATTPVVATVSTRTAGEFASVTARSTTTITVAIKKHDNTPGTTQIIDWRVSI